MSQGNTSQIQLVGVDREPKEEAPVEKQDLVVLEVVFDPEIQAIRLGYDKKNLKSWDFLLMMLEGARVQAEFQRNLRLNEKIAVQQMEKMQDEMVKQQLAMEQAARNGS